MARTKTQQVDINALLGRVDPSKCNDVINTAQNQGTPLFTVDDLRTTSHPLARLLRYYVIRNNITKEKFEAMHRKLSLQMFMSINNMNYERNNMKRSLSQAKITWDFLEKFLLVCGEDLLDFSIVTSNHNTGEVSTTSLSDAIEMIKDNPYHPNIIINRVTHVEDDRTPAMQPEQPDIADLINAAQVNQGEQK